MNVNGQYMRTIAFFIILLGTMAANAQKPPVWKVTVNKKKVLEASAEDTIKNVIQVKKDDLSNNGVFKLDYKEGSDHPSGWMRTIAMIDNNNENMAQRDSATAFYMYNKDLLKLLWSRKKIGIYTWATPLDKGVAAAVRIRRYQLCTLVLID